MSVGPATVTVPVDTIGQEDVRAWLIRCARALRRHQARLTRLDARLGDGDHGENMVLGFEAVERMLEATAHEASSAGELLRRAGHCLVSAVGGASGPLYGTAFIEAGFVAGSRERLGSAALSEALRAAADGLTRRGRCRVGDKTILDTLEPAARAMSWAIVDGAPLATALRVMVGEAHGGMRATRSLIARRGLALRLGARSVGHLDPGAASCYLLLRAMLPA
jgi:dihydroxyacetone kinase-like protein